MVITVELGGIHFTEEDIVASVCRSNLWEFVQEFWSCIPSAGKMIANWHMEYLCNEVQEMMERVFRNEEKKYDLVVNVSPGTSKSMIFTVMLPAWAWTRMPSCRFICASHTDSLVMDLASRCKMIVCSDKYKEYFPEIELASESTGDFSNTMGGERKSCTVAGKSPTGRHAQCVIVDDPLDPKKAMSEAEILTARNFMTQVIPSRKVRTDKDIAVTMLIMQRLHQDDPTGVMITESEKEDATPVKHICLPAHIHDPRDEANVSPQELIPYYVNGWMDPIRLSEKFLKSQRTLMGEYGYSGQYRQSPSPPGGGKFKCFVAGTLVETDRGTVPIESIKEGDYVLTRYGYREVVRSGVSGYARELVSVLLSDGSLVTCTPDHLVFFVSRGFDRIDSVRFNDRLVSVEGFRPCNNPSGSGCESDKENIFVSVGAKGLLKSRNIIENMESLDTSMDTMLDQKEERLQCSEEWNILEPKEQLIFVEREGLSISTEMYGSFTKVLSPLVITYITKTETQVITRSKILNASLLVNIQRDIELWLRQRLERVLGSGIDQMKVEKFIGRGLRECGIVNPTIVTDVSGAEVCFSRVLQYLGSIAALSVGTSCIGEENIPVYDLSVKSVHEFFADGVLVHNCEYFSKRVKVAPYACKRVRYTDKAATELAGCRTASVLMAMDSEGNLYVEHVVTGQWETNERNAKMRALALRDRLKYGPKYEPIHVYEKEPGSAGKDVDRMMAKVFMGFRFMGDNVSSRGSKEIRADPWADQLAGGNVYLVDNGASENLGKAEWDIQDYILEHCSFPNGTFVDQVDASSGGFCRLIGMQTTANLRSYSLSSHKKGTFKIVICEMDDLKDLMIDHPCLLLTVHDPLSFVEKPLHALDRLVDWQGISFCDLDPKDHQESWDDAIPGYGKPCRDLMFTLDVGKKMWSFMVRRRSVNPEIWVLAEERGTNRVESIALGMCDLMRVSRSSTIYKVTDPDFKYTEKSKPSNEHICQQVKTTRSLVVG